MGGKGITKNDQHNPPKENKSNNPINQSDRDRRNVSPGKKYTGV